MSKVSRFFKNFTAVIIYSVCAIVGLGFFASGAYLFYTDRFTVYLNDKEVVVNTGSSYKIELIPKNHKYFDYSNYIYKSMDESVARVEENGNVIGVSNGQTQIVIKYKKGLSKNILNVIVEPKKEVIIDEEETIEYNSYQY